MYPIVGPLVSNQKAEGDLQHLPRGWLLLLPFRGHFRLSECEYHLDSAQGLSEIFSESCGGHQNWGLALPRCPRDAVWWHCWAHFRLEEYHKGSWHDEHSVKATLDASKLIITTQSHQRWYQRTSEITCTRAPGQICLGLVQHRCLDLGKTQEALVSHCQPCAGLWSKGPSREEYQKEISRPAPKGTQTPSTSP